MIRIAKTWTVVLFMLVALVASCGGKGKQVVPTASKPLSRALSLVTSDGTADARTIKADFSPMKHGAPVSGAIELRGNFEGAAIELLDGERRIGKLWIKGGTTLSLGEDEGGHVRLALGAGEARYRSLDTAIEVGATTSEGVANLGGRDVLLYKSSESTRTADIAKLLEQASWTLALETKKDPAGVGSLEAHPVDDAPAPAPTNGDAGMMAPVIAMPSEKLALTRLDVKAQLEGDMVQTTVDETFHNGGERRLEGTFRFPMPDGAILVGLSMEIDGKLMDGELVEQNKAKKIYQEIVDQMQDPALLEWEQGNVFKLRVFPIEPKSDKRVVLKYLSPIRRGLDGYEWVYATSAPGMQASIGSFRVEFGNKTLVDKKNFVPGTDVVVPLPSIAIASSYRETRKEGVYTSVRIRPDWSKIAAPKSTSASRNVVVIVDTSRSMLEERPLALDALRMLLSELRPVDRFRVVAADVDVRDHAETFVAPTPVAIDAAVDFIKRIEPDGASDLGAALKHASVLVKDAHKSDANATVDVVYLGDGSATWGETDSSSLQKLGTESLGSATFHAMVLGNASDGEVAREVANALGGRVSHPRTQLEAKKFALTLGHSGEVKRLVHATIAGSEGDVVFPSRATTIFEGDEIVAVVRSKSDAAPPKSLTLNADGYTQSIAIDSTKDGAQVSKRWAIAQIAALEREGDTKKDEVVKTSLDFGVMSRHTSFLVLESEEAYAKYDIERKSKKNDGAPKVTGADLESVGARTASMDPNHLQPGDPEVRILAPADAQSVVVVLPFGETKIARYEPAIHAWTVRFLIDKDTPDGTYDLVVRVTNHDGTIEVQKLEYVVDTQKPTVDLWLTATPGKPGSYDVHALQVVTDLELKSTIPIERRSLSVDEDKKKFAHILTDVKRVEVRMPDGQEIVLNGIKLGEFRSTWTPASAIAFPAKVHVVAMDRAVNESVFDVSLSVK